ncbi:hypothetical protein GCM10010260_54450 [Streptomyces filipinensis]|uniref:Uncharacterized protein n=1 Tax=Streptomyces filipinensis TaxID=66887 RepID=A0A918IGD5_9ACTN|nr:hypothetical protein GCM10010260_54450 [Streptomyces filipinensis]
MLMGSPAANAGLLPGRPVPDETRRRSAGSSGRGLDLRDTAGVRFQVPAGEAGPHAAVVGDGDRALVAGQGAAQLLDQGRGEAVGGLVQRRRFRWDVRVAAGAALLA